MFYSCFCQHGFFAGSSQSAERHVVSVASWAQVLDRYRRTHQRLDSHMEPLTTAESLDCSGQLRHFRQVTEVMHFLSHAQHALSDVMPFGHNSGSPPPVTTRVTSLTARFVFNTVLKNIFVESFWGGACFCHLPNRYMIIKSNNSTEYYALEISMI